MPVYDIDEVMKVLPHRYPFLMVDRILECDFKERIVGLKNLTINEPFFQGHFPGEPVMPGVLQLETMAQVGGILVNRGIIKKEGIISYFLAVDNARFRQMLRPGDQLIVEVKLLQARSTMFKMHGQITVDGKLACEADLMFGTPKDK